MDIAIGTLHARRAEVEDTISDMLNRENVDYEHPRVRGKIDLLIKTLIRDVDYGANLEVRYYEQLNLRVALIHFMDENGNYTLEPEDNDNETAQAI